MARSKNVRAHYDQIEKPKPKKKKYQRSIGRPKSSEDKKTEAHILLFIASCEPSFEYDKKKYVAYRPIHDFYLSKFSRKKERTNGATSSRVFKIIKALAKKKVVEVLEGKKIKPKGVNGNFVRIKDIEKCLQYVKNEDLLAEFMETEYFKEHKGGLLHSIHMRIFYLVESFRLTSPNPLQKRYSEDWSTVLVKEMVLESPTFLDIMTTPKHHAGLMDLIGEIGHLKSHFDLDSFFKFMFLSCRFMDMVKDGKGNRGFLDMYRLQSLLKGLKDTNMSLV